MNFDRVGSTLRLQVSPSGFRPSQFCPRRLSWPPTTTMGCHRYRGGLRAILKLNLPCKVVHGQPTVGQYTAAATAYPAPAPGTAVPVGYSAAAAASAATSYAAARPAAPSVLPAAYSAYPQVHMSSCDEEEST